MKFNQKVSTLLERNKLMLVLWCIVAAFGTYFCMYAFRKPFNSGVYSGITVFDLDYKVILVIAQVLGYMSSKFIGIKVVSELNKSKRALYIIGLIFFAEFALFLFGIVPQPYNFIFLFLNGLPLGMVWGIVFSFLEGRRLTELLAVGLTTSAIVSSGFLKTLGRNAIESWGVPEFWMPFTIGLIFLPLLFIFVWMLTVIPAPTEADKAMKSERVSMNKEMRKKVIQKYAFGLATLVITYVLITICRDFRDNFMIEIWHEIDPSQSPSVFTWTEFPIALAVTLTTSLLVLFKNNRKGLWATYTVLIVGIFSSGVSTFLYINELISPLSWMFCTGLGMYMAYVPFQIVIYERLIATFRIKGNAGFLMYLSDSSGYLGSVLLLLNKEIIGIKVSWFNFFTTLSFILSIGGTILLVLSIIYFRQKIKKQPVQQDSLAIAGYS